MVVVAAAVAITTIVIYPVREVAPAVSTGVLYLLAVLLVSSYWGLWLGLLTAIVSAATFNWFHILPTGRFTIADGQNWVALGVFLATALIASSVSELARSRAAEAERRREEADLAADMARMLLAGNTLPDALAAASTRLQEALEMPGAAIVVGHYESDAGWRALPLDPERSAALLVPADLEAAMLMRVRDRVVPPLQALVAAALDRDRLQSEVVEAQALRRSDVIKTALLRTVSHDLRSPLTAIIAAGDAIGSPTMRAEERRELAAVIVDEARRLARLVEKLLDLSRLQAGGAAPRRDWCSVEEVVRSAVEHFEDRQEGSGIELSLDPDLPLIQADPAQLERAFVNLLENARRFSAGHPVKLRARDIGGRVAIRVIDRGPGISRQDLPHVFEPFRQGSERGEHSGSGLGLAIVKGFVEVNGGRVRAASLPGQGTVFAVEFPVSQREPLTDEVKS
jgi:two-component system sensor histidine kinase KdpD